MTEKKKRMLQKNVPYIALCINKHYCYIRNIVLFQNLDVKSKKEKEREKKCD